MKVKGLGAKKAEAIVEYRKTKCFERGDELTKVKGLGAKSKEKMNAFLAEKKKKK